MLRALIARLGIRHQLWALFGLFLLTGATVLLVDEAAQYRARQSLLALRGESLLGLRQIKRVSDGYGLDMVDTVFRTRNYLITWDEGLASIDNARRKIDEAWATLAPLPRTPEEETHLKAAAQERQAADAAMLELRAILVKKDIRALGRFADTKLYPAIDPVTARLKLLSDLSMRHADEVVEANLRDNRRVSALRIGLSLAALMLAALVGRYVLRNAYRGVESLTYLARRMREHDYVAQPRSLPRSGELGQVADAFLAMRQDVLDFETELTQQLHRNEQTRAKLERRELFQRSLLDAAQVAILAMDGQGRWNVFNPFAERLLGWRADEVVGRVPRHAGDGPAQPDDAPLMIARDSAARIIDALSQKLGRQIHHDWQGMYTMAEMRMPPQEARLLHKDGHEVPVLIALAALHDDDGERMGLIAVATDLTQRNKLEAELRASEARAQAASHAKSTFLASMSHEIRTPMIGVTGMLEVLAHSRLDTDQRHAINVIQQSSHSLLQIIGDILDFSKIEAGRLEISPTVVNLEAVVRSTVANYTGAASSKGLNLTCQIDPRIGRAHTADALRLRQILSNFLSNAIKFTATGQVDVALEWAGEAVPTVEAPLGAQALSFRVTDTGIGVDAQAQQRLFQPFAQAEQDTTRNYGGTGLGLAICARLAELMGGMVIMDSAPGRGTTMRVNLTLPRAAEADLPTEATSLARSTQFTPRPLPTPEVAEAERSLILLADDHPTNRMVIARQLALAGYASESAADGVQALDAWRSGRFALVLSDVHMPEMDGYALAGAIRADETARGLARTPVVALTASALKGEAERCLAAGMDDYLAKPVAVPVLAACLQRWLPHTVPLEAEASAAAGRASMQAARDSDVRGTSTPAVRAGTLPDDIAAPATLPSPVSLPATPTPPVPPPASLPQLDAARLLDAAVLAELTGGDDAVAGEVMRDFLDATAQDLHDLAHARDHVDAVVLTRQAHKIKGAARIVGALELGEAAADLEAAGPAGDWSALLPLVAGVETAAEHLRLYAAERFGVLAN